VARAFDAAQVLWSPYRSMEQAVQEDPRFQPQGDEVFSSVHHPGVGRFSTPGAVTRIAGEQRRPAPPAPRLGRDTEAVFRDVLGMTGTEIASALRQGLCRVAPG